MALDMEIRRADVLELTIRGKLDREDYERFVPEIERRIREHGRVRLLIDVREFKGWTAGALWEDLKFDVRHYRDVERVAFVADSEREEWLATASRPFTAADIRFFERPRIDEARAWLEGD